MEGVNKLNREIFFVVFDLPVSKVYAVGRRRIEVIKIPIRNGWISLIDLHINFFIVILFSSFTYL